MRGRRSDRHDKRHLWEDEVRQVRQDELRFHGMLHERHRPVEQQVLWQAEVYGRVVEPTFDSIRPCNMELKSYLEADYLCIKSKSWMQTI